MHDLPPVPVMTGPEAAARFEELQRKMMSVWTFIGSPSQATNTTVIVPSLSLDHHFPGVIQQAYEERFLFMLFLLRWPHIRLVYVTSQAVQQSIVEYYLDLLPGVVASHARKRLFMVAPLDGSSRPLTQKLLERPRLLADIRTLIDNPNRAHLVPFNTTELERDLAVQLGIPMYGADPRFFPFGTKSGGRRLFAQVGAPHPLGVEHLYGTDDLVQAIARLRRQKPAMRRALVKLNEGVSGEGNAQVDLEGLPEPGASDEAAAIAGRVRAMRFELPEASYEPYMTKFAEYGGVVEERISGTEVLSPSVQLRITPFGQVELLSTHDQLLGGPGGQSYLGCKFPADPAYAPLIMREARKVGEQLAHEGVIGRLALDFVVVREPGGSWDVYAIEINLRKGGTTHPFLTLQFLTDGRYDANSGLFTTARGQPKYFVASDHVESPDYRVFTPDDLLEIVSVHGLHFDHTRQTGVVLHMLSSVGTHGRFGFTAIGDSPEGAQTLYDQTVRICDEEARRALRGERLA
jgi:hypothetical protein